MNKAKGWFLTASALCLLTVGCTTSSGKEETAPATLTVTDLAAWKS